MFAILGGGLSLAFALTRPRVYQSWATLSYDERIQSQLVLPNREEVAQRSLGDRYRELLLSRRQLGQIIADPLLDPDPGERDQALKIDRLRLAVRLESRGANVFRIAFADSDPERAERVVDRLTTMLQGMDASLRNAHAAATVAFANAQLDRVRTELTQRETAYTGFLAQHPEFAQDTGNAKALHGVHDKPTAGSDRLYALLLRRQQIAAKLNAPSGAPPPPIGTPRLPERIAADKAVQQAQIELDAAMRDLEVLRSSVTVLHPAWLKAQDRVTAATQRLRDAMATLPPEVEPSVRVATSEDRVKLQDELRQVEAQIREERSRTGKPGDDAVATAGRVVELEGEYNELRRAVIEQREEVESLAGIAFRARLDAEQKLAEQGGRLTVVDPAFKPARPAGPGRTIVMCAGMILFLVFSLSLVVGLAMIDDRLYRRADLDHVGLVVLAVIPPTARAMRKTQIRSKLVPQGSDA